MLPPRRSACYTVLFARRVPAAENPDVLPLLRSLPLQRSSCQPRSPWPRSASRCSSTRARALRTARGWVPRSRRGRARGPSRRLGAADPRAPARHHATGSSVGPTTRARRSTSSHARNGCRRDRVLGLEDATDVMVLSQHVPRLSPSRSRQSFDREVFGIPTQSPDQGRRCSIPDAARRTRSRQHLTRATSCSCAASPGTATAASIDRPARQ